MPAVPPQGLHASTRWLAALLVVAVVAVFSPVVGAGWVWDDAENFLHNPHWRGLGIDAIRWMWTSTWLGHYQPLSWMTLGAESLLWGPDPRGYHATNLGLHAISAVLFFGLLGDLFPRLSPTARWFGAVFFALHPLRVESVAWITERRDVLALPLALAAVRAWLAWARTSRKVWLCAAVLLHLASLLAKAHAVTLPVVLLVLDVWPLGRYRVWQRCLVEKLPFIASSVVLAAMAVVAQRAAGAMVGASLPLLDRLRVMVYGYAIYPGKLLLPLRLSPLYPAADLQDLPAGAALGALLVVTAGAVSLWKRCPGLLVAWTLYVVMLLPVSGLVQSGPQLVADRYLYFAGLPFAALAAGGADVLLRRTRWFVVPLVAWGAALAVGANLYTRAWTSNVTLWAHAAALDPGNSIVRVNLAAGLLAEGRQAEALGVYEALCRDDPSGLSAVAYGEALRGMGRPEEALRRYESVPPADPRFGQAQCFRGEVLAEQGALVEAVRALEAGVALGACDDYSRKVLGDARAGRPSGAGPAGATPP